MQKIIVIGLLFFTIVSYAQNVTTEPNVDIFERIASEMTHFKIDTTAVPDDKLSKKIVELRALRGGFNISEAMDYKIAEERQKENAPIAELDNMAVFFASGNGKKWLDNAVVWIYRKHFTYHEVKQLIKFYKTTAGKKMADNFPIIMIQSLKAAEEIGEVYKQSLKN